MKCKKCGAGDSGKTGFCDGCLKFIVAVSSTQAAPENIQKALQVRDLKKNNNSQERRAREVSTVSDSSAASTSSCTSATDDTSDLAPVRLSSKGSFLAKHQKASIAVCIASIVLVLVFGGSGKARLEIVLISVAILFLIYFISANGGFGSRLVAAVSGALKFAAVIMIFAYMKSCAVNNAGSVVGGGSCELGLGGNLICPRDY